MHEGAAQDTTDGTLLLIHVQPKAARTECVGFHGGALKIRIAAPPVEGAANDALIRFLAEQCGLPRTQVLIQSGAEGRRKRVRLKGISAAQAIARLVPQERSNP